MRGHRRMVTWEAEEESEEIRERKKALAKHRRRMKSRHGRSDSGFAVISGHHKEQTGDASLNAQMASAAAAEEKTLLDELYWDFERAAEKASQALDTFDNEANKLNHTPEQLAKASAEIEKFREQRKRNRQRLKQRLQKDEERQQREMKKGTSTEDARGKKGGRTMGDDEKNEDETGGDVFGRSKRSELEDEFRSDLYIDQMQEFVDTVDEIFEVKDWRDSEIDDSEDDEILMVVDEDVDSDDDSDDDRSTLMMMDDNTTMAAGSSEDESKSVVSAMTGLTVGSQMTTKSGTTTLSRMTSRKEKKLAQLNRTEAKLSRKKRKNRELLEDRTRRMEIVKEKAKRREEDWCAKNLFVDRWKNAIKEAKSRDGFDEENPNHRKQLAKHAYRFGHYVPNIGSKDYRSSEDLSWMEEIAFEQECVVFHALHHEAFFAKLDRNEQLVETAIQTCEDLGWIREETDPDFFLDLARYFAFKIWMDGFYAQYPTLDSWKSQQKSGGGDVLKESFPIKAGRMMVDTHGLVLYNGFLRSYEEWIRIGLNKKVEVQTEVKILLENYFHRMACDEGLGDMVCMHLPIKQHPRSSQLRFPKHSSAVRVPIYVSRLMSVVDAVVVLVAERSKDNVIGYWDRDLTLIRGAKEGSMLQMIAQLHSMNFGVIVIPPYYISGVTEESEMLPDLEKKRSRIASLKGRFTYRAQLPIPGQLLLHDLIKSLWDGMLATIYQERPVLWVVHGHSADDVLLSFRKIPPLTNPESTAVLTQAGEVARRTKELQSKGIEPELKHISDTAGVVIMDWLPMNIDRDLSPFYPAEEELPHMRSLLHSRVLKKIPGSTATGTVKGVVGAHSTMALISDDANANDASANADPSLPSSDAANNNNNNGKFYRGMFPPEMEKMIATRAKSCSNDPLVLDSVRKSLKKGILNESIHDWYVQISDSVVDLQLRQTFVNQLKSAHEATVFIIVNDEVDFRRTPYHHLQDVTEYVRARVAAWATQRSQNNMSELRRMKSARDQQIFEYEEMTSWFNIKDEEFSDYNTEQWEKSVRQENQQRFERLRKQASELADRTKRLKRMEKREHLKKKYRKSKALVKSKRSGRLRPNWKMLEEMPSLFSSKLMSEVDGNVERHTQLMMIIYAKRGKTYAPPDWLTKEIDWRKLMKRRERLKRKQQRLRAKTELPKRRMIQEVNEQTGLPLNDKDTQQAPSSSADPPRFYELFSRDGYYSSADSSGDELYRAALEDAERRAQIAEQKAQALEEERLEKERLEQEELERIRREAEEKAAEEEAAEERARLEEEEEERQKQAELMIAQQMEQESQKARETEADTSDGGGGLTPATVDDDDGMKEEEEDSQVIMDEDLPPEKEELPMMDDVPKEIHDRAPSIPNPMDMQLTSFLTQSNQAKIRAGGSELTDEKMEDLAKALDEESYNDGYEGDVSTRASKLAQRRRSRLSKRRSIEMKAVAMPQSELETNDEMATPVVLNPPPSRDDFESAAAAAAAAAKEAGNRRRSSVDSGDEESSDYEDDDDEEDLMTVAEDGDSDTSDTSNNSVERSEGDSSSDNDTGDQSGPAKRQSKHEPKQPSVFTFDDPDPKEERQKEALLGGLLGDSEDDDSDLDLPRATVTDSSEEDDSDGAMNSKREGNRVFHDLGELSSSEDDSDDGQRAGHHIRRSAAALLDSTDEEDDSDDEKGVMGGDSSSKKMSEEVKDGSEDQQPSSKDDAQNLDFYMKVLMEGNQSDITSMLLKGPDGSALTSVDTAAAVEEEEESSSVDDWSPSMRTSAQKSTASALLDDSDDDSSFGFPGVVAEDSDDSDDMDNPF